MMDQANSVSNVNSSPQSTPKAASPCILVIFGAAGDLTKRLLLPSICNLGSKGLLDKNFSIIGISRKPFEDSTFREEIQNNINEFVTDPAAKKYGTELVKRIYYITGDFEDKAVYATLDKKITSLAADTSKNCIFYLAVPADSNETIANALSKANLLTESDNSFRRLVIEKPFGHDLASAQQLNALLLSLIREEQIYRVDHFLGKETVQNILAFRFANGIFEPIWNHLYIDNIQITVAETLGVEQRGGFYEETGALRDMIPNHLFQMLSLIAMEPPKSLSDNYIRDEKEKALDAVQRFTAESVVTQAVRGQYGPGKIADAAVPGYRAESKVAPDSNIETYVALKLFIENSRWLNVPFYLRTGKRMTVHKSEIIVQFKPGPSTLFSGSQENLAPNLIRLSIQPDEGISLQFNAKIPGPGLQLHPYEMKFSYADYFNLKPLTGYETILYDCMNGDHVLFKQADIVETGWEIVQPILEAWNEEKAKDFPNYSAGSWGPKAADDMLAQDGHKWQL